MEYTLEMAEEIARKLRDLPPVDASKRRLSKQAIIQHLAAEIAAMQDRGHSLEQVAACLCGFGLEITTPTLKSYLQRTKKRRRKHSRKAPSTPTSRPPGAVTTPGPKSPSAVRPVTSEKDARPSPGSTKTGFISTDRERL